MKHAHPLTSEIERAELVKFQFCGEVIEGHEGEAIAVALMRANIKILRNSPHSKSPRGIFCVMGICQECLVIVDGIKKEACRSQVQRGLIVEKMTYETE
jgi:predicted molibdopterin-dependent oxidoreductase YjgC